MIVLLGGTGFVGIHLQRELALLGESVVVKGESDGDFRENVDSSWCAGADGVIVLAGVTRAANSRDLIWDNLRIVASVIDAYAQLGTKPPLLFLSSLHVYAISPDPLAINSPTSPSRSLYGWVKRACETFLQFHAGCLEFPLWIGRAGNLVAPSPPMNRLSFLHDMRMGLKAGRIVIRSSPKRDLVWIHDLARGLLFRLKNGLHRKAVHIENVCSGRPLSLAELAAAACEIWKASGGSCDVEVKDPDPPDIMVGAPPVDRVWGSGPTVSELARLLAAPDTALW